MRHRAVLPPELDEPVRPDSADRVPAERAVVDIEEDPNEVLSQGWRSIVRPDVHADKAPCIRRGETAGNRRVEPVVRTSTAAVIDDAVTVDVTVRLRV